MDNEWISRFLRRIAGHITLGTAMAVIIAANTAIFTASAAAQPPDTGDTGATTTAGNGADNGADEPGEPPDEGAVFSITTVDDTGFWVHFDGGIYDGVMAGMKLEIRRATAHIADVQVTNAYDRFSFARVIPQRKWGAIQAGDTARLLPFVPMPDDVPEWSADRGPASSAPDPPSQALPADVAELHRVIDGLHAQLSATTRDNRDLRLERDTERAERLIAQSRLADVEATLPETKRQLQRLQTEVALATTFGTGVSFGVSMGDPLFGAFSLGVERPTLHVGASLDVFSFGPLDGFRVDFQLLEQPGRISGGGVETVLRASFGVEIFLPLRAKESNTALVIGYRHHEFPVPFRGVRGSGELHVSWGRRVPMTQVREMQSFWSYEFRPIFELVHDPWNGTGTDFRLGIGFPDLIVATVNFNWSYYTNTGRFGALHVAAKIPVLQDHGDLGSFILHLTGDWVLPFDTKSYNHVGTVALILTLNLGR